jgi:hypothetical protein
MATYASASTHAHSSQLHSVGASYGLHLHHYKRFVLRYQTVMPWSRGSILITKAQPRDSYGEQYRVYLQCIWPEDSRASCLPSEFLDHKCSMLLPT